LRPFERRRHRHRRPGAPARRRVAADERTARIRRALALQGFVDLLEYDSDDFPAIARDGLDVPNSPRGAIKAGLDRGFVLEAEYQPALDLIADRNTCSQIYKQSLIPGVLARLPAHARLMQAITARLPVAPPS